MMRETENSTSARDPMVKLRSAIEILQKFNRVSDPYTYFHISSIEENGNQESKGDLSVLQKTMNLAKNFISDLSGTKKNQKKYLQLKEELLDAIGILKSHHYLKSFFNQETDENVVSVCNSFNQIIKNTKLKPISFSDKISKYFFNPSDEESENDVPNEIDLSVTQEGNGAQQEELLPVSEKVLTLVEHMESQPCATVTLKEIDAFRVKAMSLLTQQKSSFGSFEEVQSTVRNVPMKAFDDQSHINIRQTISPFPGEVLILKGSFKKDPRNLTHSIPISESFQLRSLVAQTGFPHSIQHHGLAFSDALLPGCPQRPDQLPLVGPLLQSKDQLAKDLLPNQSLYNKAKKLLKEKVVAFEDNLDSFLGMHKKLNLAIVIASGKEPAKYKSKIDAFIDSVKTHPTPIHYLAETNDIIMKNFIKKPYLKVLKAWLEKSDSKLIDNDPAIVYEAVKEKLIEARKFAVDEIKYLRNETTSSIQKTLLDYILSFGHIISDGTLAIQCQILSEQMNFRPPMLTDFERKLQAASFKQETDFINQMNFNDVDLGFAKLLENQLAFDIELFQAETFDTLAHPCIECVQEIEDYFNSRYFITSKSK